MRYKFVPDSYDKNMILSKFGNEYDFVECLIKYKKFFEKNLCHYVNFDVINDYIKSCGVVVPKVGDKDYNFYHKYSMLGSDYLFVRNNFHIERLDDSEISELINNKELSEEFISRTANKVLYENDNYTFFGIPMLENRVNSRSIIFEFAFNQYDCESVLQLRQIEEVISKCFMAVKMQITSSLNVECSFIKYNGITDLFAEEKMNTIFL